MIYRCLFEQSGTFKNEFKKLGYEALDLKTKFNYIIEEKTLHKEIGMKKTKLFIQ